MPLSTTLAGSSARGFGGLGSFVTSSLIPTTNLKAWYDAADTTTISLSGSNVTQWNDKSGNGFHLSQGNNSLRPQSGTLTINSKNVLDFDSARVDTLTAASASDWVFLHNAGGATIFVVWDIDAQPSGDPFTVLYTRSGSVDPAAGFAFQVTTAFKTQHAVNIPGSNICINVSTSTNSANTPVLWILKSDPNNATAADKSSLFKNSGNAEKNNTTTGTPGSGNPAQALRVGDYADNGTVSFDGQLAEIIMYSGILSNNDTTTVKNYLTSKWGI